MAMIGQRHTETLVVGEADTAAFLGSGSLAVLATPRLLVLIENAAAKLIADSLPEGAASVGGAVQLRHLAPTPVGQTVEATAELTAIEGRRYVFSFEARDAAGKIAEGEHTRFAVDGEAFMRKAKERED